MPCILQDSTSCCKLAEILLLIEVLNTACVPKQMLYLVDDVITLSIIQEVLEKERSWFPGNCDYLPSPQFLQYFSCKQETPEGFD